jgi:hypothetical protein
MGVAIEEAVRAWLVNDPDVGPLVSKANTDGTVGYQVYKESIAEDAVIDTTHCAIGLNVDSDVRERSLAGVTGDLNARVMLTLESDSPAQLEALYEAVRGRPTSPKLDGLTARQLGFGGTNVWCQYCEVEDRPDDFTPSPHAKDAGTYLTHLALRIAYYSP